MTTRRFYAAPDQFEDKAITLDTDETRHLRDVLRLKTGDIVRVFDGVGREFECEVDSIRKKETSLQLVREVEPSAPESKLEITLAAAVYKSDKLDLVVQKAVELGISSFVPVVSLRSESKLRDATKRVDRWRKIAMEATKQCERALVMTVSEPLALDDFLATTDDAPKFLFSEKGGGALPEGGEPSRITALVGPKGGWEDNEIEAAVAHGFIAIKLGRRIMRAETAAIAFAAVLQHRFGDLN
ncbi:MAG TPA: 16S rRNA (uracil(1498)-N(3))-methyltransferase [Pyrinomonadaceae bacterium]|nr:16S rRNA (uracil(1498)-N(3))-methyltransferase [Pyrinomonadaceae bacterium]